MGFEPSLRLPLRCRAGGIAASRQENRLPSMNLRERSEPLDDTWFGLRERFPEVRNRGRVLPQQAVLCLRLGRRSSVYRPEQRVGMTCKRSVKICQNAVEAEGEAQGHPGCLDAVRHRGSNAKAVVPPAFNVAGALVL